MSTATILLVILALSLGTKAASIPLLEAMETDPIEEDNSLSPNAGLTYPQVNNNWVRLNNVPSPVINRLPGKTLKLECEASGSPAPTIHWLRNNRPITETEDYESNDLLERSVTTMAILHSRIIINNFTPAEKTLYTCVARAGSKTTYYTTTVLTPQVGFPKLQNTTEYLMLNEGILSAPSKPTIVNFYRTVTENIGGTLIVPCKAIGNPRPEIYWIDSEDSVIPVQHPRMQIMRGGELVIRGLRWNDMGGYTCVAKNSHGKDIITTFVYPMSNEK